MGIEVWIQPSLLPEYPTTFWAYEMDDFGNDDFYWEVYDDGDTMIGYYNSEEFADFLDFARDINYDVKINTQQSWIAMEDFS